MVEETSFCQSGRVLITNGAACSNFHWISLRGSFLELRANQRRLWTSRENAGGISRSAWKTSRSCRFLILFSSHVNGISQGASSTRIHARRNVPPLIRKGTRNREEANQRIPTTCPCPARAASIQRSDCTAFRRLWRMERPYHAAQLSAPIVKQMPKRSTTL